MKGGASNIVIFKKRELPRLPEKTVNPADLYPNSDIIDPAVQYQVPQEQPMQQQPNALERGNRAMDKMADMGERLGNAVEGISQAIGGVPAPAAQPYPTQPIRPPVQQQSPLPRPQPMIQRPQPVQPTPQIQQITNQQIVNAFSNVLAEMAEFKQRLETVESILVQQGY